MTAQRFLAILLALVLAAITGLVTAAFDPDAVYPQRSPVDQATGGHINISGFAFRDLNRSGSYDLGDQAMRGVVFLVIREDGRTHRASTNAAGFANFNMSASRASAVLAEPGRYRLVAVPPPGHEISTDNAEQELIVHALPGTISDLYLERFPRPVGIAPVLRVTGTTALPLDLRLIPAAAPDKSIEVPVAYGHYAAEVPAGTLVLEQAVEGGGERLQRRITIDQVPVHLSRIQRAARQHRLAQASRDAPIKTIDFEGLIRSEEVRKIPNGYGGLRWSGFNAMHVKYSGGAGYRNTSVGGHSIAYNSSGHPGRIAAEQPFDLLGVYLGVGWRNAEGERLTVSGYVGDELVYQDTITLSIHGPVYFAADYLGVTHVHFATERYWQFAMDRMTVRLAGD